MLTVIYILLYIFQGITAGVFMHLMLTPKYSQKTTLMVWIITSIWIPFGRMMQNISDSVNICVMAFGAIIWVVVVFFLYSDPLWKRLTAPWLTLGATCFADAIVILVFYLVDPVYLDGVTGINNRTMIMAVSVEAALVIIYMCILQIWNLIRDRRLIKGYLPTLLLPISQFCFSAGANLSAGGHSDSYSIAFFLGAILGFCLDIYWMYELLYRSRRTEAEQELREMHHVMELEHMHYREIENKREEIAKIRHDINNQILAARHLMMEGDMDRSEHMLDQLLEQVSATKEYPYCAVPIINAILNEKSRLCEQYQIEFITSLSFPSDLHADDVMLCSLFSNLLDNAIHAVEDMDPGKRWIRISAVTEGGFLIIKTKNPSEPPQAVKRGRGKGTVILREIAEMYGGTYHTEYREQIFTALVSMELKKVYES